VEYVAKVTKKPENGILTQIFDLIERSRPYIRGGECFEIFKESVKHTGFAFGER